MKLSLLSVALASLASCTFASNIGVVIKTDTLESHPAGACIEETDIIKEELFKAMGIPVADPTDDGSAHRQLFTYYSPYCEHVCSQFPNHSYCFAYIPSCACLHAWVPSTWVTNGYCGRRLLRKETKTVVGCDEAILDVEGALVDLADFVDTDECRSALVNDKKEYDCISVDEE